MTFAMPFDVYRGTLHAASLIWKSDGFRGFFRGIIPSLFQIAPYIEPFGPLCCGALAGVSSKTAIYPLDVVRHRLQVHIYSSSLFTFALDP
ncbi:unnamed protein product [Gongylonema pulchrum]|uniref:Sulfate_transp domain-containing protein n=1 Tax=Gongylonema pulchrum TaxID=637853 RepID=A0A183DU13_9BILA|nr:unnamed protein product [Gongylonema pulchrum]